MTIPKAIEWIGEEDGYLRLLDQTRLPTEVAYRDCQTLEDVRTAILELAVRGAPAIGVAAAYGLALWMGRNRTLAGFQDAVERLRSSRPTAVNLMWALDRMSACLASSSGEPAATLLAEARRIEAEDREMCEALGRHGAELIRDGDGVLTHCNTGALATAGIGTALGALIVAHRQGKRFRVFADETRPLLQGSRLTAWELQQAGIDVTLLCDNMAAQVMKEGRIHLALVGADRITANGDAANKIGTYGVAVLCKHHGIPFHVSAPSSTFDLSLRSGDEIPIEQRNPREVTHGLGKQAAPDGVKVYNPAFDVTPASLITGLVTENGRISPVTESAIRAALGRPGTPDSRP
jgi:methylthioribose-1-phosphate isomerase